MNLRQLLPASSFVPFRAYRLARPTLVWHGPAVRNAGSLLNFAYALPVAGETPDSAFTGQYQELLGERYGGEAIGFNGGGVRCGLAGPVQIKGIGSNPLASPRTEHWHTYGGASLEEALREAVWGEICHLALPYRAVRTLGVLATGTHITYPAPTGPRLARRALILRQPALRPAHFMRAVFFSCEDAAAARLPSDGQRTRAAILAISGALEASLGVARVDDALHEMVRRFAVQLAAAYAKRITHGTLTSSNIALDGRWMDFGTITTTSDYGPLIVGRNDVADFTQQHNSFQPMIADLIFYLKKHLPAGATQTTAEELWQTLTTMLVQRQRVEMLKLTGIPEKALAALPMEVQAQLARVMACIAQRGNAQPFKLAHTHLWRMPEKMGRYHLNSLMAVAARSGDATEMAERLSETLDEPGLVRGLVQGCCVLRESYWASLPPSSRATARAYVMVNAQRVNARFADLYMPDFESRLAVEAAGESPVPWIDALLRQARTLLAEPQDGWIDLGAWADDELALHPLAGALRRGQPVELPATDAGVLELCGAVH